MNYNEHFNEYFIEWIGCISLAVLCAVMSGVIMRLLQIGVSVLKSRLYKKKK